MTGVEMATIIGAIAGSLALLYIGMCINDRYVKAKEFTRYKMESDRRFDNLEAKFDEFSEKVNDRFSHIDRRLDSTTENISTLIGLVRDIMKKD